MNFSNEFYIWICSALFAVIYYIILRYGARRLKNMVLAMQGKLKETDPGGRQTFRQLRKELSREGLTTEEIENLLKGAISQ